MKTAAYLVGLLFLITGCAAVPAAPTALAAGLGLAATVVTLDDDVFKYYVAKRAALKLTAAPQVCK